MLKVARLIRPFANTWAVAGETLALPLVFVGAGMWLQPLDPMWLQGGFPWLWLAPVLLALRYGPLPGLAGAGVLLVAWLGLFHFDWIVGAFPKTNFLGGLILVMLCGEFSSLWLARTRRAEGLQRYLDQRLEHLTHQHYLLRLSHDRLEQDMLTRPMAMRDALAALSASATEEDDPGKLPGASSLLRLLAQYCQIEIASVHEVNGNTADPGMAAHLGPVSPFSGSDPLVLRALESGSVAHIARSLAEGENPSIYLVAAPLVTFDKRTIGLLVVERLPFFALSEEILQTINLMLSAFADGLAHERVAEPVRSVVPSCPLDFAFELQRLTHLFEVSGMRSVIVALVFPNQADFVALMRGVARQKRGLDVIWLKHGEDRHLFATLMPMGGEASAEGYLARIDDWTKQQCGKSLVDAGIAGHVLHIDGTPPATLAQQLLEAGHFAL